MARLDKGLSLKSILGIVYTVERYLNSGTQAAVYQVSSGSKKYALKWYSKTNKGLITHFRGLLEHKAPNDKNKQQDKRFVWPQDMIVTETGFGYTMDLIEMSNFITLYKLIYRLYINGENCVRGKILCDICINIAEAFINLHSAGYCYKDISSNNIVFNIKTGEVLIFDVDNVVVSGEKGEIQGTPKFMAPEVILKKTHPDRDSDKFSLAAYFFFLFVGHCPFDGKLRDDYIKANGALDDNGFITIYGTNALFCFDPGDSRNNLNSSDYAMVVERWNNTIPLKLKEMFIKTFVKGLPFGPARSERTTDKQWVTVFNDFKQNIITCSCGKEYFPGAKKCTKCNRLLIKPTAKAAGQESVKVLVREKDEKKGVEKKKDMVLKLGTIVKGKKISNALSDQRDLAQVVENPKTGELGLQNISALVWYSKDASGKVNEVPPSTVVKLISGRTIAFIRGVVQITVE